MSSSVPGAAGVAADPAPGRCCPRPGLAGGAAAPLPAPAAGGLAPAPRPPQGAPGPGSPGSPGGAGAARFALPRAAPAAISGLGRWAGGGREGGREAAPVPARCSRRLPCPVRRAPSAGCAAGRGRPAVPAAAGTAEPPVPPDLSRPWSRLTSWPEHEFTSLMPNPLRKLLER